MGGQELPEGLRRPVGPVVAKPGLELVARAGEEPVTHGRVPRPERVRRDQRDAHERRRERQRREDGRRVEEGAAAVGGVDHL